MAVSIIAWAVIAVVFLIAEIATVALVSIWFMCGAVVSLILASLNASITIQIIAFIFVSIILLFLTIPYVKKLKSKKVGTNADMFIGKTYELIQEIKFNTPGLIKIRDITWNAESGEEVSKGVLVKVIKIEGNKLIVEKEN